MANFVDPDQEWQIMTYTVDPDQTVPVLIITSIIVQKMEQFGFRKWKYVQKVD